ncbi:MAG: serpin family protein [Agathobacter sp.]|nr:serpin family protein [Agathobacter sp.]
MKGIKLHKSLCIVLATTILLGLTGCAGAGDGNNFYESGVSRNLMEGVTTGNVEGKEIDEAFVNAQLELDLKLFQQSVAETPNQNTLISPLSIQLALAMTANGADGNTKKELEQLLADSFGMEDLNKYLYTYVKDLPTANDYKVNVANSIWFKDDENAFQVEQDFLQTNADYYGAKISASPFDNNTVTDMNNWVEENTDGMIKEIIDEIPSSAVMYLINAIAFDAKWEKAYTTKSISDREFYTFDGTAQSVQMMSSEESLYLEDDKAKGFIKPYKNNKYSFVALLPKESGEEAFYDYIESLTPENVRDILQNVEKVEVETSLPKFSSEYSLSMQNVLESLGVKEAFNGAKADFSMLGKAEDNIYISQVIHKTFIEVDENGTKAAAVTSVEVSTECEHPSVYLNRPFVYMIIDNETNLPIFIGTLIKIEQE